MARSTQENHRHRIVETPQWNSDQCSQSAESVSTSHNSTGAVAPFAFAFTFCLRLRPWLSYSTLVPFGLHPGKIAFPFSKFKTSHTTILPILHQIQRPSHHPPAGPSSPFEVGRSRISQLSVEILFSQESLTFAESSFLHPRLSACQGSTPEFFSNTSTATTSVNHDFPAISTLLRFPCNF